jgi:hypothetical protein
MIRSGVLGALLGALTVWLLAVGWINREHTRAVHWVDSTGAAHQATVDILDRQRVAALELAAHHRVARELAQDEAARAQTAAARAQSVTAGLRTQLLVSQTGADSLPVLVALVASQDTTIGQLTTEAGSLRAGLHSEIERSAALTVALGADSTELGVQRVRIGELEARVRAGLPSVPSGKLFGFIPRPRCLIGPAIGPSGPQYIALACGVPIG